MGYKIKQAKQPSRGNGKPQKSQKTYAGGSGFRSGGGPVIGMKGPTGASRPVQSKGGLKGGGFGMAEHHSHPGGNTPHRVGSK